MPAQIEDLAAWWALWNLLKRDVTIEHGLTLRLQVIILAFGRNLVQSSRTREAFTRLKAQVAKLTPPLAGPNASHQ